MKLQIHREASAELEEAAAWYEREQEGLGAELLDDVEHAIAIVLEAPATWPLVPRSKGLRRFVLTRFPYVILYAASSEWVRVFAIAHQKRRPGYWKSRRFE